MENVLIEHRPQLTDEARAAFARCLAPKSDTTGGLQSVDDLVRGALLFDLTRAGEPIGHYALAVHDWTYGREGVIVAAAGQGGEAFSLRALPALESQFLDARAIKVHTRRLGLVQRLARQGYQVDGFILRKRIARHDH